MKYHLTAVSRVAWVGENIFAAAAFCLSIIFHCNLHAFVCVIVDPLMSSR